MTNIQRFQTVLTAAYIKLFEERPGYGGRHTPESLAEKMTIGLVNGTANHDGDGIKQTCKTLNIKFTRTSIRVYLKGLP